MIDRWCKGTRNCCKMIMLGVVKNTTLFFSCMKLSCINFSVWKQVYCLDIVVKTSNPVLFSQKLSSALGWNVMPWYSESFACCRPGSNYVLPPLVWALKQQTPGWIESVPFHQWPSPGYASRLCVISPARGMQLVLTTGPPCSSSSTSRVAGLQPTMT